MMKNVWKGSVPSLLLAACIAVALAWFSSGCSDDTTDDSGQTNNGDNSATCPAGERYNPILGQCVPGETTAPPSSNGNTTSENNQTDGGGETTTPTNNGTSQANNNTSGTSTNNNTGGQTGSNNNTTDTSGNNNTTDTSNNTTPPNTCGIGTIIGRACAPSGDILAAATVTIEGVDCADGSPFSLTTTTGGDGSYRIENVPSGTHEVTIKSGSFERSFSALITDGQETDLTRQASKYCLEADTVELAVISGEFDDVEGILTDLGLDYTEVGTDGGQPDQITGQPSDRTGLGQSRAFLSDYSAMQQYDIIFINCGNLWLYLDALYSADIATIATNLQRFVGDGGSVYASDWAHMFIETPFPNQLDFYPQAGADDDQTPKKGYAPQVINASVESPQMQALLGTMSVNIDFPHDPANGLFNNNWVMMSGANASTTVHLRGDASLCSGTRCSTAGSTVTDLPLLVTYKSSTGGAFAFTSFHNHAVGTPISPQISQILKFLIFQL